MARLPQPGSDTGVWGEVLNEYLTQALKPDGSLKDNAVTANTIAPNSITNAALATNAVNATIIADGSISENLLNTDLRAKINDMGSSVTSVAGMMGDVALGKSDVGLDQVDNTSDVAKNAATASLSNKTLVDPKIHAYTEGVAAIGVVATSYDLNISSGTVLTATLTASTGCVFTMPPAAAGKSFTLFLRQAATVGNGYAAFSGVKWGIGGAPTITATAGKMDILSFFSDGTNWYGQYSQGYTP